MDAAQSCPGGGMQVERLIELRANVVETARLESVAGRFGVAVHRVSHPQHALAFATNRIQMLWQFSGDLGRAHTVNQCQSTGLVFRIEMIRQAQQVVGLDARADLDCNRIADSAHVLGVRAFQCCRAHADPRVVCGQIHG